MFNTTQDFLTGKLIYCMNRFYILIAMLRSQCICYAIHINSTTTIGRKPITKNSSKYKCTPEPQSQHMKQLKIVATQNIIGKWEEMVSSAIQQNIQLCVQNANLI